jgi:transposase
VTATLPRYTRAERLATIRRLLDRGMTHREIADYLGISRSAVRSILNDPDGGKQRARRTRYQGRCGRCGTPTDGSNGRAAAPTICATCDLERRHEEKTWTAEAVIEAIQRWAAEHGRPPRSTDWIRAGEDGSHPAFGSVYRTRAHPHSPFSSWADAIEAAGFPRPAAGRYQRENLGGTRAEVACDKAGTMTKLRAGDRERLLVEANLRGVSLSALVREAVARYVDEVLA